MPDGAAVVYACDGTLGGILCCVFESYTRRESPADILPEGEPHLFHVRHIPTEEAKARRVWNALRRMGGEVADWVYTGWLSDASHKEWKLYAFIRRALEWKAGVTDRLGDTHVNEVFKAVRATRNESHYFKEFLRFSEHNGVLVSVIAPKAMVLPFIAEHYSDRFSEERFFIYDETHQMALAYEPYRAEILSVEDFKLPPSDEREERFEALWKRYYATAANQLRLNPKCRMTHMPKRYWSHMLEMKTALPGAKRRSVPPYGRSDALRPI